MIDEANCNYGQTTIVSTTSSAADINQCINYNEIGSLSFIRPSIVDPAGCTDESWQYVVALDSSSLHSPLPSAISFGVDHVTSTLFWSTDSSADPTADQGSYTIAVTGYLPDLSS